MAKRQTTTRQRARDDAAPAPPRPRRGLRWPWVVGLAVVAVAAGLAVARLRPASRPTATPTAATALTSTGGASGDELYATFCASCHGREGRGDGPAAPLCRVPPADFTRAEFKVRSTASGALPRDQDLQAVIRRGAGADGAMPAFPMFGPSEIDRLVATVKTFSPRWRAESAPAELPLPRRGAADAGRGAAVYAEWGCAACHGTSGAGDGPRARELRTSRGQPDPPTDLRRPSTFKGGAEEPDLARSIVTGFNGTTMPGLQIPAGGEARLWDLAAYLRSIQEPAAATAPVAAVPAAVGEYWRTPVPAQAPHLAAATCAGCHAAQFRDWSGARHALAMSPGVWAQMRDDPGLAGNCLSCHAPLQEQHADDYLMTDGVSCAACHARGGQRAGPPVRPETLDPLVGTFPSPHGTTQVRDFFEQSAFCAHCHQFAPGEGPSANGKMLENTLEEWRASRAAREGKACQACHMPDRRHLFRGIHDPATVAAGVRWSFDTRRNGPRTESRVTLTNTEVGHAFPTYTVPEVWLRIETIDGFGTAALVAEKLIGRPVVADGARWRELSDTRLLQDETATLVHDAVLPPGTRAIAGSVIVRPDAYHVRSLTGHRRVAGSDASRRMYNEALAEMGQSDYVLFREVREVPR